MISRHKLFLTVTLISCLASTASMAQGTREDYQRAEQFLPGNLRHHVYVADVTPHWIAKTNHFWYRKTSAKGTEFLLVDPARKPRSRSSTMPVWQRCCLNKASTSISPPNSPLTLSISPKTRNPFYFESRIPPGCATSNPTTAKSSTNPETARTKRHRPTSNGSLS